MNEEVLLVCDVSEGGEDVNLFIYTIFLLSSFFSILKHCKKEKREKCTEWKIRNVLFFFFFFALVNVCFNIPLEPSVEFRKTLTSNLQSPSISSCTWKRRRDFQYVLLKNSSHSATSGGKLCISIPTSSFYLSFSSYFILKNSTTTAASVELMMGVHVEEN